jgi:thiol-disulfide isomerase/thioredoxin
VNSAIDQFIENVPANSLAAAYMYPLIRTIFNGDLSNNDFLPGHLAYIDAFLQSKNVSVGAKTDILLGMLSNLTYTSNEKLRKKYYTMLMEKFPGSEAAKTAKEKFSKEIKIYDGVQAPQFSLTSLDDPKVTYTLNSFKGKILLLDFWATWCGPCKEELPNLKKQYEKFHSKGLEVLSISFDKSPEEVAKYRAKVKMPWHHAFLKGGFQSKMAKDYEVSGIPKPILIDCDTGKILAMTMELRGERLEKTLEKFLK